MEIIGNKRHIDKNYLRLSSIIGHLCRAYENDKKSVDLTSLIAPETLEKIREAQIVLDYPDKLSPYYLHFDKQIDYDDIRVALLILGDEGWF